MRVLIDALYTQTKATGQILLEEVYKHLGLEETDYFGLQFIDRKQNVVSYAQCCLHYAESNGGTNVYVPTCMWLYAYVVKVCQMSTSCAHVDVQTLHCLTKAIACIHVHVVEIPMQLLPMEVSHRISTFLGCQMRST